MPSSNRDYKYYEKVARSRLHKDEIPDPIEEFPRDPFHEAHRRLSEILELNARKNDKILELGAGIGNVTGVLSRNDRSVTALDFSPASLHVLKRRYPQVFELVVSDMETLPFKDNSFDWVVCVSVLSYVNRDKVEAEIRRVLKPEGYILIIDSLRGFSIYHLNRIRHVFLRKRSFLTLFRMPNVKQISHWNSYFTPIQVTYTGYLIFTYSILKRLFGETRACIILRKADESKVPRKKSWAFKFLYFGQLRTSAPEARSGT